MQIRIKQSLGLSVASSVEQAVFDALKKKDLDFTTLSQACDLYTSLTGGLAEADTEPTELVDVPDSFAGKLADMLEASLPAQAAASLDADMPWLMQMMNLIRQLRGKADENKVAEKGYEKKRRKPEPVQEKEREKEYEDDLMR